MADTHKTCTTEQGPGVCCQAVEQGRLAPNIGAKSNVLQFTTTTGKTRCGTCEITASQSKNPKKRGQPVFRFRLTSCGPSGCLALARARVAGGGTPLGVGGQPQIGFQTLQLQP